MSKMWHVKDDHDGAVAVEGMILTPLVFVSLLVLLYFFFMLLAYINYGNIANNVAKDLNMHQTGYENAMQNWKSAPSILTYSDNNGKSFYLNPNAIVVKSAGAQGSQALLSGTWESLNKYKDHFAIPFSQVNSIQVETIKNVDTSQGERMAGNVVEVHIYWTSLIFRGKASLSAVGYNVIS
jgi:hypothetical protein